MDAICNYTWELGTKLVAVDLGTTRSTMVSTHVGSETYEQDIVLPGECKAEELYQSKLRTVLLLKWLCKVDSKLGPCFPFELMSFGEEAIDVFLNENDKSELVLIQNFKMKLHELDCISCDPILETKNGISVTLSQVLSLVLKYFKEYALKYFHKKEETLVEPSDIVWVLTVPAIWSDPAKRMMRRAAYSAGLIDDIESPRLVLCLEPEAVCFAGLYGIVKDPPHDSETQKSDSLEREAHASLNSLLSQQGQKFVVLDAGGGTVDIASYEVVSSRPFQVKQLAAPTGGPFGSTQVDGAFMEFLRAMLEEVSPEAKAALDARYDVQVATLRSWEVLKLNIVLDSCDPDSILPSVIQLEELHSQVLEPLGLNLRSVIGLYAVQHEEEPCPVARGDTRCELPGRLLQALFRPSIELIERCLRSYLQETPAGAATHLILAGGYSRSNVLWRAIKNSFGGVFGGQILMVAEPDTAIVRGAAIYGTAHKHLLTHRIASHTYGFEVMIPYQPRTRPEHVLMHRHVRSDQERAEWIPSFRVQVRAGKEVPANMVTPRVRTWPLLDSQKQCEKRILATPKRDPLFPSDEGVGVVGRFLTPVDTSVPYRLRFTETEMEFGGVELRCRTYHGQTGELVGSCTADLLF